MVVRISLGLGAAHTRRPKEHMLVVVMRRWEEIRAHRARKARAIELDFDIVADGRALVCPARADLDSDAVGRSEEHTSELQSLMRISYAVFCLKKKNKRKNEYTIYQQ